MKIMSFAWGRVLCAAALFAGATAFAQGAPEGAPYTHAKKMLVFVKSAGFQHGATRLPQKGKHWGYGTAALEKMVRELGYEPVVTKDGGVITAENLKQFRAVLFYTTGCLDRAQTNEGTPPVPPEGKQALINAVRAGMGFVGVHSASDTWHSAARAGEPAGGSNVSHKGALDPYIAMLGGEFVSHGNHQPFSLKNIDVKWPGNTYEPEGAKGCDECYSMKDFAEDMHVILAVDPEGMLSEVPDPKDPSKKIKIRQAPYRREAYPYAWARAEGLGRVFYHADGHGTKSWNDARFLEMVKQSIRWVAREIDADLSPNLDSATPKHAVMPPLKTKENP